MKSIALLHTVPSVLQTFDAKLRSAMPNEELHILNTMDEFLASDANLHGFTRANENRLFHLLKALELESPDVIVITCSTLTPCAQRIRPFVSIPLVCIDEAMTQKAAALGDKIMVLATAQSTVEPTKAQLRRCAERLGKTLTLSEMVCAEAYDAVRQMDIPRHDRLLMMAAATIRGQDAVVLAQASMAHMEAEVEAICCCQTLSSPGLCIEQVKEILTKE